MSKQSTASHRAAALDSIGAVGAHHQFGTADVVVNPGQAIYIVTDMEPAESDWSAIVGLLSRAGYDNGCYPFNTDPGEPEFHAATGTCTWRLCLAAPSWPCQPSAAELN